MDYKNQNITLATYAKLVIKTILLKKPINKKN